MNIRFLETFVWLAKLKSFRLTAEKLHTTQAAVSSRIASLEQDFGTRLFDRDSRDVTLTRDGMRALAYAERIVKLAHAFRQEMLDHRAVTGVVRIGVIESIMHSWLPSFAERVHSDYPKLDIELTGDTSLNLNDQLQKGHLDLALNNDVISAADVVNMDLGRFSMSWVASPRLPIADGLLDVIDLVPFPILSFSRNSAPHKALERMFSDLTDSAPRINCVTSLAAIIRLIGNGFGLGVVPLAVVQQELREGSLRLLRTRERFPDLRLSAAYRSSPESPLIESIALIARDTADRYALAVGKDVAEPPVRD